MLPTLKNIKGSKLKFQEKLVTLIVFSKVGTKYVDYVPSRANIVFTEMYVSDFKQGKIETRIGNCNQIELGDHVTFQLGIL